MHNGHKYLIDQAKKQDIVICVISGNFVQRGDTAIAEKRVRALAALKCGADIVLELPVLWSMSTAQNFALGGVSALKYAGCDRILFGSESGDIDKLTHAADILCSEKFSHKLSEVLCKGVTFAAARQYAAQACGTEAEILTGANNNLGIEYIAAAKKLGYSADFITVKRIGARHDCMEESEYVSACLLREKLKCGDYAFCEKHMPKESVQLFKEEFISDISRIEKAVLAVLRTKPYEEFCRLPDLSEGVENKLFSASRVATCLEELYNTVKVKRYTLSRIRRLVLSCFIGADDSFFMKPLPYIRVLGFSKAGETYIRQKLCNSAVPVIIRTADIKKLDADSLKVFNTECRATDLFSLSLPVALKCDTEYTSKIIKTEC